MRDWPRHFHRSLIIQLRRAGIKETKKKKLQKLQKKITNRCSLQIPLTQRWLMKENYYLNSLCVYCVEYSACSFTKCLRENRKNDFKITKKSLIIYLKKPIQNYFFFSMLVIAESKLRFEFEKNDVKQKKSFRHFQNYPNSFFRRSFQVGNHSFCYSSRILIIGHLFDSPKIFPAHNYNSRYKYQNRFERVDYLWKINYTTVKLVVVR